jgi:hypothetical protein
MEAVPLACHDDQTLPLRLLQTSQEIILLSVTLFFRFPPASKPAQPLSLSGAASSGVSRAGFGISATRSSCFGLTDHWNSLVDVCRGSKYLSL